MRMHQVMVAPDGSWFTTNAALFFACCVVGVTDATALNAAMRCSACQTIAKELDKALRVEEPQGNILLSGRMKGTGGKQRVVSFKHSELRIIETFETLCSKRMEGYFLLGDKSWLKLNSGSANSAAVKVLTGRSSGGSGALDVGGPKSQEYRLALRYYCDALVEEHEESMTTAIRSEVIGGFASFLCVHQAAVCTAQEVEDAKEEDIKAELDDEIATANAARREL